MSGHHQDPPRRNPNASSPKESVAPARSWFVSGWARALIRADMEVTEVSAPIEANKDKIVRPSQIGQRR